ncbi:hypothetical protein CF319_g5025 [Tilletia indica]|uniref:Uncharacterized protein n=1 Tax=Tilletia indica TaxID=43049 RepID=A0A177TCM2_9BASI|nr:hypothetical protein CF319_g5025 [Tilletia indica]KAE8250760.1 hypothetical protein A4X13_0g4417 [Tilletia indica]
MNGRMLLDVSPSLYADSSFGHQSKPVTSSPSFRPVSPFALLSSAMALVSLPTATTRTVPRTPHHWNLTMSLKRVTIVHKKGQDSKGEFSFDTCLAVLDEQGMSQFFLPYYLKQHIEYW